MDAMRFEVTPTRISGELPMTPVVMYVEDDRDYILILDSMLRRRGYKAVGAVSVTQAIDSLSRVKAELIILDVNLPDGTGIELLHYLRSQPATRFTPVIMFSSATEAEIIRQSIEAGASSYLYKEQLPQLLTEVQLLLNMKAVASIDA
ncbi:response regulator [Anaerolineae bacterium CFX9]|nr:response regulator [Anaerolineae bacterium CFX9]